MVKGVNDPRHEAEVAFRTAALEDSRMIAMVMPKMIGGFAWWTPKISARFRRNGERIGLVHGET